MNREEAINVVKCNMPEGRHQLSEALRTLIPELQESEDEIHRKWILEYLYDGLRKADEQFKDHFKAAIDWLEKQKDEAQKQFNLGIQAGKEEVLYEMEKEQQPFSQEAFDAAKHEALWGEQHPAEWSEEDKEMLEKVLECIRFAEDRYQLEEEQMNGVSVRLWLLEHINPQPHWKPSAEQMKALLSKFPVVKGSGDKVQDILESLYNDLKKL